MVWRLGSNTGYLSLLHLWPIPLVQLSLSGNNILGCEETLCGYPKVYSASARGLSLLILALFPCLPKRGPGEQGSYALQL